MNRIDQTILPMIKIEKKKNNQQPRKRVNFVFKNRIHRFRLKIHYVAFLNGRRLDLI